MDIFLARQPILDRNNNIYAYELLFRGGTENLFPDIDGDSASSRVLSNTFFTSDLEKITNRKKIFINFTHKLITKGIPLMFPPESTVIEILEDVQPDEDLIDACRELKRRNYMLALDDFVYREEMEPLLELANIVKLDFMNSSEEELRSYTRKLSKYNVELLAEKVESLHDQHLGRHIGCNYFQGYFFCKPQIIKDVDIPTLKMNHLRLLSEINNEEFIVDRLEKIIMQDVSISYKLLRYLNSPFFRRSSEITSIKHAIIMLGESGLRRFVSIIVLAELNDDKPDELIKNSIIRAKICEGLSFQPGSHPSPSELFTVGLFSLIDAILGNSMENILKQLAIASNIKETLLGHKTNLHYYLMLAKHYQEGNWNEALHYAQISGIDEGNLLGIYMDAIGVADALFEATR